MKFNNVSDDIAEQTRTENHEGGEAFEPDSPELALTKVVINNLLEETYYESPEEKLEAVEQEFDRCADENPEFILKLAKYARQSENLRQIPQALLVLAANDSRTQEYVRDYAKSIMSRADEPLDVLAFHTSRNGTTLPNCLQKSIEDSLHQYSEHQFAKWDRPSRDFQYRDLLNLVHPAPRDDERDAVFEKIAHGELDDYEIEPLKQEDTWESSLSEDDGRSKAESYRDSLEDMGLFPRIRQARDMLESGITANEIYGDVTKDWIHNAKLYPFRFHQAYTAVKESNDIPMGEKREALDFLENAMSLSAENLPDVLEDTFVAVDTSGSMRHPVSNNSDLECVEIASLFGALVYQRGADLAAFASSIEEFHGDRRDTVTTLMNDIQTMGVGGGTSGYLVPKALADHNRDDYSQVIVFTDMEMWGSSGTGIYSNRGGTFNDEWTRYKQEVNTDASLYLVDLQNYGDLTVPEGAEDVYQLSGWTENVIDFIDKMENVGGMIREIESVEPDNY
jgi:hypothetical protein